MEFKQEKKSRFLPRIDPEELLLTEETIILGTR